MMSTEMSAQPSITSTTSASIVEVEPSEESLFKLQRPPSLDPPPTTSRGRSQEPEPEDGDSSEDKLMMTEYDEDNVIVIDLSTQERNSTASTKNFEKGYNDEHEENHILRWEDEERTFPRPLFDLSDLNGGHDDVDNELHNNTQQLCDEDERALEEEEENSNNRTIMEDGELEQSGNGSSILPPVLPLRNHNSTEAILTSMTSLPSPKTSSSAQHTHSAQRSDGSGDHRRKSSSTSQKSHHSKLTRRSQTVSVPEKIDLQDRKNNGYNGLSFNDLQLNNNLWRDTDTTTTTTTTTTDDETLSRQRQHHHQHRRNHRQSGNKKPKAASASSTSSAADITVLRLNRRSASCRRAVEVSRPATTTFNLMSMSMIGNSLSGAYTEPENSYERRRKARSNDFLDRIDISVISTTTKSAANTTTTNKRKLTPKMNRIDRGLFLGSLEAATDVILLESNAITHIVTVDSVPLPRKITSMMPRIAILHLQVTDLPEEDLLSHFQSSNAFIEDGLSKDGAVLVHCYRGRSRSATVIVAYLMQKHGYSAERALAKVRAKREIIQPHESFLAQLRLYENMDFTLDPENLQYKMFKLHMASGKMRKAKILFRDILDTVIDPDPTGGLPGSAASAAAAAAKSRYPMVYKCKKCRRTLATAFNLLPHVTDESPVWTASKWSLPAEDVLEAASDAGLQVCSASVFINPVRWMEPEIRQNLTGRLYCPNCQTRVGQYSWVRGEDCGGCEAKVNPAFSLDVTEIIFRTKNRFLQSTQREPVVV